MESPPAYMPPQKKKMSTGMLIAIILGSLALCCILIIGVVAYFGMNLVNKGMRLIECSYAFKDVNQSLKDYADDHNGMLPAAANWQDDVTKYYEKVASQHPDETKFFKIMPASGTWGCQGEDGSRSGIAFNTDVAAKKLSEAEANSSIMLFEVKNAVKNANGKYEPQPDKGAPTIMGKPRGWFIIRANGTPSLVEHGVETPIHTRTNGMN
jgi:hypothetical protein